MKSEITNSGAGAGDVQRIVSTASGGVKIGECHVTDNGGGAGNIPAIGSIIIVECKIADGGAGAVNFHLGLRGNGDCEHHGGKGEFCQSFHIFSLFCCLLVPAFVHRTAFTHCIAIGFGFLTTFSDALTAGVTLGNLKG